MARKVKIRRMIPRTPSGRSLGKSFVLPSRIEIRRAYGKGDLAFQACIVLAEGHSHRTAGPGRCGKGKNPRVALANALVNTAERVRARTGAFARYRKR
jgi:hypothetical protein